MHSFLEVLWREFRLGVRLLAKDRGFTIVAGLTLALGIGATTAIFSVFDATVLAPLPYREPDRLVLIEQTNGEGQFRILAPVHLTSGVNKARPWMRWPTRSWAGSISRSPDPAARNAF